MEVVHPSEITSERFNNTRDFIVDVIKRSKDWKALYSIAPVTESYARGDIELHLHLFLHFDSRASIFKSESGNRKGKAMGFIHPIFAFGRIGTPILTLEPPPNNPVI